MVLHYCPHHDKGRLKCQSHGVTGIMSTAAILLAGILIGWIGGTSVVVHRERMLSSFAENPNPVVLPKCDCTQQHQRSTSSSSHHHHHHHHNHHVNNSTNGWNSIDVFRGSIQPNGPEHKSSKHKWHAQARQDQTVFALLRNRTDGYFVDLAANDAIKLSNTYSLEHYHGWTGLCIEPNPIYWYNLSHYRPNCRIVGAVVGERRDETVHFLYTTGIYGGIAGMGFDNKPKSQKDSLLESTVTLEEIFHRNKVPTTIDYLSLDVEGAESFIMNTFPLAQYRIKVLTVERPKRDLRKLLESHGYYEIQRLSRWGGTLWAHYQFHNELDFSCLDESDSKKQLLAAKAEAKAEQQAQTIAVK